MVASSVNYVVVEKISWKHDNSTVAGGKALADLVLADGTKVAGATIASPRTTIPALWKFSLRRVLMTTPTTMPTTTASSPTP